jgi:glutamate dehydrogenase (NADP+)
VKLVNKGVAMVLEGANMPSTNDAIAHFHKCNVVLAAAKACNAGGVAVSGLEMAQNACMTTWSSEQVDERLKVGDVSDLYVALPELCVCCTCV